MTFVTTDGPPTPPLVAVVDDDPSVLRSLARLLRLAGYAVEMFQSGPDFIESLSRSKPQCLVLDLQMPGMTGQELHARLQELGTAPPVIVITAQDSPLNRAFAAQAGAIRFLAKPFDVASLLAAVARAVPPPIGPRSNSPPPGVLLSKGRSGES